MLGRSSSRQERCGTPRRVRTKIAFWKAFPSENPEHQLNKHYVIALFMTLVVMTNVNWRDPWREYVMGGQVFHS